MSGLKSNISMAKSIKKTCKMAQFSFIKNLNGMKLPVLYNVKVCNSIKRTRTSSWVKWNKNQCMSKYSLICTDNWMHNSCWRFACHRRKTKIYTWFGYKIYSSLISTNPFKIQLVVIDSQQCTNSIKYFDDKCLNDTNIITCFEQSKHNVNKVLVIFDQIHIQRTENYSVLFTFGFYSYY